MYFALKESILNIFEQLFLNVILQLADNKLDF